MSRKWYIVSGMLIILGFAAALWFYFREKEVEGIQEASGQVRGTEVTIGSKVAGKIEKLVIKEGQKVKAGDLIAEISSREIEARLEQARSEVEAYKDRLKEVQATTKKIDNSIQQAEVNLRFVKEDSFHRIHQTKAAVQRAEADVQEAESQRKLAEEDFKRYSNLLKQGAISRREFEVTEAKFKATEARLDGAKKGREEARATLERAQASTLEVEAKEKEYRGLFDDKEKMKATYGVVKNQMESAQAKVREIKATFQDTIIHAPSSGTVINKLVEEGELVAAGTPIAVLIDLSDIYVRVYISERDIGKVRLGNPARILTDAFPDRYFEGQVTEISQEAEFTPKEVQMKEERTKLVFGLKVRIENPKGYLKPGLPVDVKIRWKQDAPW